MKTSCFLQVLSQKVHGALIHNFRLHVVSVVQKSTKYHIVCNQPDRAKPVGRIVGNRQVKHFLILRKRGQTEVRTKGIRIKNMLHHICSLLFCGNSCIHGNKARPYTYFDGQCLPEDSQSLVEPVVFPCLNIHIN